MSTDSAPPAYPALDADYEIIREIGRGGTALVYLARERASGTEVAIKVIRAKYIEDEEALARFGREARFVAQLDHPNIVPIRTVVDTGSGGVALVMAHVAGRTLKQVIRDEHPIAAERVERMMRDVAGGLGAAHVLGIVHRDVKPENIFIDDEGRALLADFGLARSMTTDTQLTMAGVAIGTPSYMAPEQIDGGQLDARGDIYSLGLVAWEMLTGKRPWDGESLYAVLYHQKYEQLPDVRDMRADVPDFLADAIAGSIEKDRDARWQTVEALTAILDARAAVRPSTPRVPIDTQTVRFARPITPPVPAEPVAPKSSATPAESPPGTAVAPASSAAPNRRAPTAAFGRASKNGAPPGARGRVGGDESALADIAAELTNAERVTSKPSKARLVIGTLAAAAIVIGTVLGANALQNRTDPAPPPEKPSADRQKPQLPDVMFPSTASGEIGKARADSLQSPANSPTGTGATGRDGAVSTTQPNLAVPAITPPRGPARSTSAASAAAEPVGAAPQVAVGNSANKNGVGSTQQPVASAPVPSSGSAANAQSNSQPTAPMRVASVDASRATIGAGGMHSCLIAADGRLFCWGGNDHGQLGNGATSRVATPAVIGGDLRFTAIAAGLSHSCAIARGGAAWCWGENDHGQLGDRTTVARGLPSRVAEGHAFRVIVAGAAHSCGVDAGGVAWCWGSNARGQLGDSTAHDANIPVMVGGGRHFTSIAAGWNFTCGIDTDAHGFCWGDDTYGELGDETTGAERRLPVPVSGGRTFISIAAGNTHACAVTTDGEAVCWGRNASGQLGDGSTSDRSSPVRVKTTARFSSIAAGAVHTCGVTGDGEGYCWGRNTYGQLGDGATVDQSQPVHVAGGHALSAIRAFGSHTCGVTPSGEAFCWGYNLDGELGDGSRTHRTRPVYIEPPSGH